MGRNRVTLQTIADRVGVSRTTVSNAYNRPDQLAAELRERILATAAELGYTGPDAAARRLRSGGREAVGLLFTGAIGYAVTDPAAVRFLQGFVCAADEAGAALLIIPGGHGLVRDAVVDAVCVYSMAETEPEVEVVLERGLPLVVVDEPHIAGRPFVGIDDRAAARLAADHLTGLGHRRFGVICFRTGTLGYRGPLTPEREAASTYAVARSRLAGWRDGLEAAGVDWASVPAEERDPNSVELGEEAAHVLFARDPGLTALLCASDQLALGAVRAAGQTGRRVPHDLSVVGFDDAPPAALAAPALTTIRQPLLEKGLTAGRLVLSGEPVGDVLLPVELVVRDSTAPPPAG